MVSFGETTTLDCLFVASVIKNSCVPSARWHTRIVAYLTLRLAPYVGLLRWRASRTRGTPPTRLSKLHANEIHTDVGGYFGDSSQGEIVRPARGRGN